MVQKIHFPRYWNTGLCSQVGEGETYIENVDSNISEDAL